MDQDPERESRAPDREGRIRYGGGHQEGGGMVEPDEFADGGTDILDDTPDHGSVRPAPPAPPAPTAPAEEADPPR